MNNKWVEELKHIIRENIDRYVVHEKCKPILEKMSVSTEFLYDIIRYNLSNPEFLKRKRTYPTLSMTIEDNSEFTLVVNIFPSLPDRSINTSFQSIHHHGSLLLSTVGVVGPGYTSVLFNKDYQIDTNTGLAKMTIAKTYQNQKGVVEFVNSYQPHVVFYPPQISATYAFWCDEKRSAKETIKKVPVLKKIKKPLVGLIRLLGLSKLVGLNKIEFFDFYVRDNAILGIKERLAYDKVGSNENFLQNIFHFIQQTGFDDVVFLENIKQTENISPNALKYIDMLILGQPITDSFFEGHLNIDKVNLNLEKVIDAATHA